jgi:hypothetical protein
MHSATTELQKMGRLRTLSRTRKTPRPALSPYDQRNFIRYWSDMYEGPQLQTNEDQVDTRLTRQEIHQLVRGLPNKKAPGPDTIAAELFKYGGLVATKMLKTLLNAILSTGSIPESMNKATICLLPKDPKKR